MSTDRQLVQIQQRSRHSGHPDDGDDVSARNVGVFGLPDPVVGPREFYKIRSPRKLRNKLLTSIELSRAESRLNE
jgi:hypothetical protein